jgi:hypothetical protein
MLPALRLSVTDAARIPVDVGLVEGFNAQQVFHGILILHPRNETRLRSSEKKHQRGEPSK